MKKLLLTATFLMIASPVLAQESSAVNHTLSSQPVREGYMGGFSGPTQSNVMTVAEAKNLSDDMDVVLVGNIVSHIKGERYMFKDETGTIVVEIDKDDWNGQDVSPNDKVKIIGEIDKDLMQEVKIDVDIITKL